MTVQIRIYTINKGALHRFADERRAMDPNPARLIAGMEQYFMEPVT